MKKIAAILIDCWGHEPHIIYEKKTYGVPIIIQLVENIRKFLDRASEIDTVILASYDAPIELSLDNIWQRNSHAFLQNNLIVKNKLYTREFQKATFQQGTYKDILDWHFPNKYQYAAHFPFELQHHYDRVYLCGVAFDNCIQERPLGLKFFKGVQYTEIFIKKDCVLTSINSHPPLENFSDWQNVNDDIFKYIG